MEAQGATFVSTQTCGIFFCQKLSYQLHGLWKVSASIGWLLCPKYLPFTSRPYSNGDLSVFTDKWSVEISIHATIWDLHILLHKMCKYPGPFIGSPVLLVETFANWPGTKQEMVLGQYHAKISEVFTRRQLDNEIELTVRTACGVTDQSKLWSFYYGMGHNFKRLDTWTNNAASPNM